MIKEEGKVRAMKRGIGAYISAILIILNGVICIVNHQQIYKWIPSLCGAILLIKGIIMLIEGIRAKDYATLEGKKFERAIVIIAIGIGIIIQNISSHFNKKRKITAIISDGIILHKLRTGVIKLLAYVSKISILSMSSTLFK